MKHRLNFSQSLSVHAKKVADNLSYQLLLSLVPKVGLEPTRCRQHRILSPARLPIPPLRQASSSSEFYYTPLI